MNTMPGDSPVVLVTGAARRIGAVIARTFHQHGYAVIVHCNHSLQEAGQLAGQLNRARPDSAIVLQADLGRDNEVDTLARQADQAYGRLDVVVNNASAFYPTPLGKVSAADWDNLIDSNLRGAFFLCQSLADRIRQHRGAIVNLLDIYMDRPQVDYPVYSIAKAGLAAMTRSLAVELAPEARVNGVAPGAILWPEHQEGTAEVTTEEEAETETDQQAILDRVPLGRTGSPEEIAATVYFLAARASYMTGEVIRVDGGRRLNL